MLGLNKSNRAVFIEGMRDGVPIGLGYLAVSFSLGIAAKNAGLTVFQSFLASMLCNASAGEYAGFTVIAASATYIEMIIITLVANARYLLMSFALSQKFNPKTGLLHRIIIGFDITDELFGISINRPGYINPVYNYGAMLTASPPWWIGSALGTLAGNLLPFRLVSAFSVALYGMFLAIIVPPTKKNKALAVFVIISFVASFAATYLPFVSTISEGTRTIILTVIISAVAAVLFPKKQGEGENNA